VWHQIWCLTGCGLGVVKGAIVTSLAIADVLWIKTLLGGHVNVNTHVCYP
jgi:hypothetical protein